MGEGAREEYFIVHLDLDLPRVQAHLQIVIPEDMRRHQHRHVAVCRALTPVVRVVNGAVGPVEAVDESLSGLALIGKRGSLNE